MCALQRVAMQHPNSHCRRLLAAAPAGPDSSPDHPLSPDAGTAGPPRVPPHPAFRAPFLAGCGPAWHRDRQQSDVAELRQRLSGAISQFPLRTREQRGWGARFDRRPTAAPNRAGKGNKNPQRCGQSTARAVCRARQKVLGSPGAGGHRGAALRVHAPRGTNTAVHPSVAPPAEHPSLRAPRTPHTRPFPHTAGVSLSIRSEGPPGPAPHSRQAAVRERAAARCPAHNPAGFR